MPLFQLFVAGPDVQERRHTASESASNIAAVTQTILSTVKLCFFSPLNTELNPICHLLALLVAHHILHVSRIRVKLG
jgi:hypothetical protein